MTDVAQPMFFETGPAFGQWLAEHHADTPELLVGLHKRGSGRASMTWPQSVDEALCVGWIDGVRRSLGEDSYTIRFTPRRIGSHWSKVNVARVAELREQGRMTPSGEAAFAARREDRTGLAAHERESPAELTAAEDAAFRAEPVAWEWFQAQAPWYRRTALHLVVSAKRRDTRARRLAALVEASREGRLIGPLRRP